MTVCLALLLVWWPVPQVQRAVHLKKMIMEDLRPAPAEGRLLLAADDAAAPPPARGRTPLSASARGAGPATPATPATPALHDDCGGYVEFASPLVPPPGAAALEGITRATMEHDDAELL